MLGLNPEVIHFRNARTKPSSHFWIMWDWKTRYW